MYSLRSIAILACTSICPAATITCTVTDQTGKVVSQSCDGRQGTYGYRSVLSAGGTPQSWSVYLDAGFYINNDYYSPLKTSISLSDYASFSLPIVVTGGSGSAYLWYSGLSYFGSHYDASTGVKWGNAGGIGANASAPCYRDWPRDWDNDLNCYVPFTYGVPFTLSGFASVNGHLSGNMEWDSWFFWARATLMGIASEPGKLQVAADEVQIQVLPEPPAWPALLSAAAILCLTRRSPDAGNARRGRPAQAGTPAPLADIQFPTYRA